MVVLALVTVLAGLLPLVPAASAQTWTIHAPIDVAMGETFKTVVKVDGQPPPMAVLVEFFVGGSLVGSGLTDPLGTIHFTAPVVTADELGVIAASDPTTDPPTPLARETTIVQETSAELAPIRDEVIARRSDALTLRDVEIPRLTGVIDANVAHIDSFFDVFVTPRQAAIASHQNFVAEETEVLADEEAWLRDAEAAEPDGTEKDALLRNLITRVDDLQIQTEILPLTLTGGGQAIEFEASKLEAERTRLLQLRADLTSLQNDLTILIGQMDAFLTQTDEPTRYTVAGKNLIIILISIEITIVNISIEISVIEITILEITILIINIYDIDIEVHIHIYHNAKAVFLQLKVWFLQLFPVPGPAGPQGPPGPPGLPGPAGPPGPLVGHVEEGQVFKIVVVDGNLDPVAGAEVTIVVQGTSEVVLQGTTNSAGYMLFTAPAGDGARWFDVSSSSGTPLPVVLLVQDQGTLTTQALPVAPMVGTGLLGLAVGAGTAFLLLRRKKTPVP